MPLRPRILVWVGAWAAVLALLPSVARGEVVQLNDGRLIRGQIFASATNFIEVRTEAKTEVHVPRSDICRIYEDGADIEPVPDSSTQPGGPGSRPAPVPRPIAAAMNELWRHGWCLFCAVFEPARRESAVPADVGKARLLTPRVYAGKGAILCYAVDGKTLWAADDQAVYQIDAAAGDLVRQFTQADGLPDAPVQSMAASGGNLWLATRSGLALLKTETGKIETVPGVKFGLAKVVSNGNTAWAVSDAGAWRLAETKAVKIPDFPGQPLLAEQSRRGFWTATWQRRLEEALPAALATDEGLYVICLNQLLRFDPRQNRWAMIAPQAWGLTGQGPLVWTMTPTGVSCFDPAAGKAVAFLGGKGPAAGRPVAMAATPGAFHLLTQGIYDGARKQFTGGGISRYANADQTWTITQEIEGVDLRLPSAILASGAEVWVTCTLYDRVMEMGANPGMAFVKRWTPHASGIAMLHTSGSTWQMVRKDDLKSEMSWVMGQQGWYKQDKTGPDSISQLCRWGPGVWGVYRIAPEKWYAAHWETAGLLAQEQSGKWGGRFEMQTAELGLAGDQPEVLLASASHGELVMADGHPSVLSLETIAERLWAICESGLFVLDARTGKFGPVLEEGFRSYWRCTAALPDGDGVWIGGDSGTISRFDRKLGTLKLVGIVPGRRITSMATTFGGITVLTEKAPVCLPASLRSAPKLPEADALEFDGKQWSAGTGPIWPEKPAYSTNPRSNFLVNKARQRVAFLKGVYQPTVLCEEIDGKAIWISTYEGVARVPLVEADP